jgi:transposase InsO family protein
MGSRAVPSDLFRVSKQRGTALIDDAKVFNDKLQEWEDFYNYHRPHGGLGGQTPYERLKQRTQTRV